MLVLPPPQPAERLGQVCPAQLAQTDLVRVRARVRVLTLTLTLTRCAQLSSLRRTDTVAASLAASPAAPAAASLVCSPSSPAAEPAALPVAELGASLCRLAAPPAPPTAPPEVEEAEAEVCVSARSGAGRMRATPPVSWRTATWESRGGGVGG